MESGVLTLYYSKPKLSGILQLVNDITGIFDNPSESDNKSNNQNKSNSNNQNKSNSNHSNFNPNKFIDADSIFKQI